MTTAEVLFSESNGRFIVEVKPENLGKFKALFKGSAISEIGSVCDSGKVIFESKRIK